MTALAFDTHEFVKRLKGAAFSEEQAEVLTDLQKTTAFNTLKQARHDYELDEIASKRDLKELELLFKRDIKELELTLNLKIAETKAELIRWVVALLLFHISIISGFIFRLTGKI